MERLGTAISRAERRAMEAERETIDRYVAAYLATHVGDVVEARITGVQSFGFFATVIGLGGDGLVHLDAGRRGTSAMTRRPIQRWRGETGDRYAPGQLSSYARSRLIRSAAACASNCPKA